MSRLFLWVIILLLCLPYPALAEGDSPQFILPVACDIGIDCWPVNYVDTDPGPAVKDYKCGKQSYENHKGVDIGIQDRVALESGMAVVAAADGTITRFRNSEDDWPAIDTPTIEAKRKELLDANKGCGNGVFIEHKNGYSTIYCHLKKDSIRVRRGQQVRAGTPIAEVGKSGFSEFPHLHFGIYKDGKVIDPFTGADHSKGCGLPDTESLWHDDVTIPYKRITLYAAGFKGDVPDFDSIKIDSSSPVSLSADSKVMAFWAGYFGANKGDRIEMRIIDPQNEILVEREIIQQKDRARQFYFVGRKIKEEGLIPGEYTGLITIRSVSDAGIPETETMARTVLVR